DAQHLAVLTEEGEGVGLARSLDDPDQLLAEVDDLGTVGQAVHQAGAGGRGGTVGLPVRRGGHGLQAEPVGARASAGAEHPDREGAARGQGYALTLAWAAH